jgi:hypothetical protein
MIAAFGQTLGCHALKSHSCCGDTQAGEFGEL